MRKTLLVCLPMVAMIGCSSPVLDVPDGTTLPEARDLWVSHYQSAVTVDDGFYKKIISHYAGTDLAKQARLDVMKLSLSHKDSKEFKHHYEQFKRVYSSAADRLEAEKIYADWAMSFYQNRLEQVLSLDTHRDVQFLLDAYHQLSALRSELPQKSQRIELVKKLDEIQSIMEHETVKHIRHERQLGHDKTAQKLEKQLKKWFPKTQALNV